MSMSELRVVMEGKRLCVVFQRGWVWECGWVCRERQKNSLSLDMAAASNPRGRHTQSSASEKKKKNCFGCRALPCLGQPSSGCEAGRPLELSLEGSILPRHRGAGTTKRRSDRAPELSRTDFPTATFSHSHIPSPCPAADSLVSIVQTANIIPPCPQPLLAPSWKWIKCPSPSWQPKFAHRHLSGCLDVGRGAASVNLTISICPHHFEPWARKENIVIRPLHPAIPVPPPLSQNLSRIAPPPNDFTAPDLAGPSPRRLSGRATVGNT